MTAKESTTKVWTAVGRRKTAVATVKLLEKDKDIKINGEKGEIKGLIATPFELVGKKDAFGLSVRVSGGGKISQLEAMRLGIARALEKFDPELRTTLKKAGFLTRDPREKERKKPGLKRARRAPQWAKR
jgi:small subunit ribosomal protein S9